MLLFINKMAFSIWRYIGLIWKYSQILSAFGGKRARFCNCFIPNNEVCDFGLFTHISIMLQSPTPNSCYRWAGDSIRKKINPANIPSINYLYYIFVILRFYRVGHRWYPGEIQHTDGSRQRDNLSNVAARLRSEIFVSVESFSCCESLRLSVFVFLTFKIRSLCNQFSILKNRIRHLLEEKIQPRPLFL